MVTSRGVTAKSVGEKFRFGSHSTDRDTFSRIPFVNAVFIATRHDTHAGFAVAALEAGKNVFVEKPLALGEDELVRVMEAASAPSDSRLWLGTTAASRPRSQGPRDLPARASGPLLINYRVNAGFLPKDHWTQTEQGGGRILGEVCHFIDLMQFLTGSNPVSVHAMSVVH